MMRFCKILCLATVLLLVSTVHGVSAQGDVTVFAAASATNALTEIGTMYEESGQGKAVFSFASSSTLAKQIENGAPADVFLSANAQWMDYLADKKMLVEESRKDLLGNRIVFIVPKASAVETIAITPELDILALL